ncbi:MAG: hypothetical protein K2Y25_13650 [Pseudomonadaceae bacterium]|nr:hypothetical protein [Pseudomonadaceae bacterium]
MKKTLLAVAITALSANAFAANLDYTVSPVVTPVNTVAKEVVAASNIALTTTDTVSWPTGFSVTNQNLVRLDLTNGAKFTANPTMTVAGVAATISAGGVGATYVIFQAGVATSGTSAAPVVLTLAGLTAATQADITIGYKLFSTQPDAVANNANTVAAGTFPYAKFANGLVFSAAAGAATASKQIDVTAESKKFANTTVTSNAFGGLNLSVNANTFGSNLSGAALTLTNMIGTTAVLTVSGSFNAAAAAGAGSTLAGLAATSLDAGKTAITFPLAAAPVAITGGQLIYVATGTTAIAPSLFNAKLTLGTGAQVTTAPADVTSMANLAKTGASDDVDLALKPGGVYSNFVRISNKSTIAGNVYITAINDAGASATFNLGDVAGQTTSVLGAGASTTQLTIQNIFNAAAAKGLALSGEGKLRLVVDAEITEGKLDVQTYTVSKDANSFATF